MPVTKLEASLASHMAATEDGGAPLDFAVGIEGGVEVDDVAQAHATEETVVGSEGVDATIVTETPLPPAAVCLFAWLVVLRPATATTPVAWGFARTASGTLPSKITTLMQGSAPLELGDAGM